MRILITGGGGYLGSVLTSVLMSSLSLGCDENPEVTVIDTFEHGPSLAHLCHNTDKLTLIKGDVADRHYWTFGPVRLNSFDVVVHLAAIVGASACKVNVTKSRQVNFVATKWLTEALPDDVALIFPCTNSGYGIGGEAECDESSPLKPLTEYGKDKVDAERKVMDRTNSVSLRLATLFGMSSRMRRDLLVNDMVWRAVRDSTAVIYEGHFRRNFCHVRDAARAICHVIDEWSKMRGRTYNVGDSRANMTKIQLCEKIKDQVADFSYVNMPVGSDPDKRDYLVSNALIESTGWRPMWRIEDGIQELISGYKMMKREEYGNV